MGRRSIRHLSHDEFYAATEGMLIADNLKVAAYLFMVQRKSLEEVAESSSIHLQSIQRKSRQIWEKYQTDFLGLPAGWVKEEIALPQERMIEVKDLSQKLLREIHKNRS